jgi:uncharacterized protein (TIGR02145 family)
MKKTLKSLGRTAAAGSVIMFGLAFLAGCGDETTEVTETIGLGNVAKGEKMPECTADNQGDMIYVVDSAATYFCQDKKWQSLKGEAGEKGDDGKNGTSCSAKQTKDKSGYEITCGDKVIGTIKNGEKGDKGEDGNDGDDGASCTAKVLEDGAGIEVSCDGTVIDTLKNGASGKSAFELSGFEGTQAEWLASLKGEAGASCTVAENKAKNGYDVTCGGKTVTVTNGTDGDGKSCKATAVEGGVSIQCGSDEAVVIKNGTNGKSAYELAKEADPTIGTVADWLASLKGDKGDAGTSCTATATEDGVKVQCGEEDEGVEITNGTNCTVAEDKVNSAYIKVTCGTTSVNIAKAYCGANPMDPVKQFCTDELEVYAYCGKADPDNKYDPNKEFCDTRDNHIYSYTGFKFSINGGFVETKVMTQNLNYYDASNANLKDHSWCGCSESTCADKLVTEATPNCNYFGRLYTRAAAMNTPEDKCGFGKLCNALDYDQMQTICPVGWHLMNYDEAEQLASSNTYYDYTTTDRGTYVNANVSTVAPTPKYVAYPAAGDEYYWLMGVHKLNDDSQENTYANILRNNSSGSKSSVSTAYRYYAHYVRCVENYKRP